MSVQSNIRAESSDHPSRERERLHAAASGVSNDRGEPRWAAAQYRSTSCLHDFYKTLRLTASSVMIASPHAAALAIYAQIRLASW